MLDVVQIIIPVVAIYLIFNQLSAADGPIDAVMRQRHDKFVLMACRFDLCHNGRAAGFRIRPGITVADRPASAVPLRIRIRLNEKDSPLLRQPPQRVTLFPDIGGVRLLRLLLL